MPLYRDTVAGCPTALPRAALRQMLRLVTLLHHLSHAPAYRQSVFSLVPATAQHDPGHAAVMMGYDFHLDGNDHPWLIEVNTNAGGALLAYLAHHPSAAIARDLLPERLRQRFLFSFAEEMRLFSGGRRKRPAHLAIVDESPSEQFLFREMEAFAELFRQAWGCRVSIADPRQLQAGPEGVFADGERVDLVYNRHCDFYLESPAMAGLRSAWLAGSLCLSPNPFTYGLLADKRRLVLWSDPAALTKISLDQQQISLLSSAVPETRLLASFDLEKLWRERQQWVFKPVGKFGSKGVFLGRKISRNRFTELDPDATLVQREVPPSETHCGDGPPMKTDFRLYAYQHQVLGVTARLYRGQVTNLRTVGGGFAPVRLS